MPNASKRVALSLFERTTLGLLFLFLLTEVLGGPIRYYADQFGLPWLPYLPHLLLAVALVPMFFGYVVKDGVTSTYLTIFVLIGVGTTYGILNLSSGSQVEFGLWVLVAFLYGVVALPAVLRSWSKLVTYAFLLWTLAIAGVLINVFHTWPWVGFHYNVGATSVDASKLWSTEGFSRLPGFTRASYDASVQILILALFLRESLRKWRIPVWILSGIAITLTTSKTPIVIYALFTILGLFYRGAVRSFWRLVPALSASLDILLPFSTLFGSLDWLVPSRTPIASLVVWSFLDRLQAEWPEWIRMLPSHGSLLLGRGVGGIGAAQRYFQPSLASPADNIAIYLYASFGVLGLVVVLVYGWRATHLKVDGPIARFFFFCACFVLLEGVTVNVLEGSFMAVAFGASLRYLQESPRSSVPRLERRTREQAPRGPSRRAVVGQNS